MAAWTKISDWFAVGAPDDSEPERSSKVLAVGNLQIDLEKGELHVEGKSVLLTRDEIDLLVFLAKHPKHFVSPHTSLSTKWTEARIGRSEFLQLLCSLQKKFEQAGAKGRYIRIEPWYLYSFDPAA